MSVAPFFGSGFSSSPRSSGSFYSNNLEMMRHYLRSLFEEVEKHVISHTPPSVTCRILGGSVRHDFRGIRVYSNPSSFSYNIGCSCGMHWSISESEFRSHSDSSVLYAIETFCEMINKAHVVGDSSRVQDFRVFDPLDYKMVSDYGIRITNDKDDYEKRRLEIEKSNKSKDAKRKARKKKVQEAKRIAKEAEDKRIAEAAVEFKETLEAIPEEVKKHLNRLF